VSAARDAILRYFREPPSLSPPDLGIVFRTGGVEWFVEASAVVEITPPLPVSALPGSPYGVAFWRGRAIEVRGAASGGGNFLLLRRDQGEYFVVSDTRPMAASRGEAPEIPVYQEGHGER
jgi:hypothetical protein